jgi:hypothetical protein
VEKHSGLKDARHIIRIVIHPRNPDIVWIAAMGHLFGPNMKSVVFSKQLMGEKLEENFICE